MIESLFPVVTLWHAHRAADGPERLGGARMALAEGRSECALVWRAGWRPEVSLVDASGARFTRGLLDGITLGVALSLAGEGLAFEPWLVSAVRDGWLVKVRCCPE